MYDGSQFVVVGNSGTILTCPECGGDTVVDLFTPELRREFYAAALTPEQQALFGKNRHLVPVSRLDDGDWLVLDNQDPGYHWALTHFGPYVLTRDGKVQDVNYHYKVYHGYEVPGS